jgi:hypothetical protein
MTDKSKAKAVKKVEAKGEYFDYCSLSREEMIRLAHGTHEERAKSHIPVSQVTTEQVRYLQPMTFLEEAACIIFLSFGVPNGVFTIPLVTFLIGKFILGSVMKAFICLAIIWVPILLSPHPFIPSSLNSWMAVQITKYFSFRFITEERPPELDGGDGTSDKATKHPQIMVGTYIVLRVPFCIVWTGYSSKVATCLTGGCAPLLARQDIIQMHPHFHQLTVCHFWKLFSPNNSATPRSLSIRQRSRHASLA